MAFSQNEQKNWWSTDQNASIARQAAQISRIDDPSTSADEILKVSKWILIVLLSYSGLLGAMSYYKNFEPSFGHQAALFFCLSLAGVIEIGKNFFAKWSLRIPFFRGRKWMFQSPQNTFLWLAATLFAAGAFSMSITNSTKGGEQLARMLRNQKEASVFQPNTVTIDTQIADTQRSIDENNKVKWKGVQTYQAQKTNVQLASTLSQLSKLRETEIAQQRTDWEKRETVKGDNSNFAAALVMASGGWVEALQILLVILIASCERSLLLRVQERAMETTTPTRETPQSVYFRQAGDIHGRSASARNPIGFRTDSGTQPPSPVSQCDTPVSQMQPGNLAKPDPAAFKHYLTAFKREVSNLKNENGARKTICERIAQTVTGMIANVSSIDQKSIIEVKEYIEGFFQEVHYPMLQSYTIPISETPLAAYKDELNRLYQIIVSKITITV